MLQECFHPAAYAQRAQGCLDLLETLGEDAIPDQGRLFNRTQIASFCVDLQQRSIVEDEDDEEYESDSDEKEEEDDDTPLSKLSPKKWSEYRELLADIRANLLRKDANYDQDQEPNAEIDATLKVLPKFNGDYHAVLNLFQLCEIVARFQACLKQILNSKVKKQETLMSRVKKAVDEYEHDIQALNLQVSEKAIQQLTSFLLADMYNKKSTKPKDLARKFHQHLLETMVNAEYEIGYVSIMAKTRRLLARWHSQVLDVPTLCRLGYGGFVKRRSSIVDADNVSVSSWGVDQEEFERKEELGQEESKETDSDDLAGYATAADDATADEEEVHAVFPSTQPPIPETVPDTPEKSSQDEEKEQEEEDVDDGDKKPHAKRKQAETEELKSLDTEKDEQAPVEKRITRSVDEPRRSKRLRGDEPAPAPPALKKKKKAPAKSPPRRRTAAKSVPKSSGLKSRVRSEEEEEPLPPPEDKDEGAEASPPKKRAAAVARKPPPDDDSDDSITEPESSPLRQKVAAVARKPPPDENSSSSSESDAKPPPRKRQAVARRLPAPAQRRRNTKKNPTVIEWSESDDDEVLLRPPPRRSSSAGNRRRSSPKKPQKRRRFTDEEKEAIREGVRLYGAGNWAVIRLNSNGILMSRTGVNIKDAYRTMKNKGEI